MDLRAIQLEAKVLRHPHWEDQTRLEQMSHPDKMKSSARSATERVRPESGALCIDLARMEYNMDMAPEPNRFVRVAPDDPTRCKTRGGECPFQAVDLHNGSFSNFCHMHGGQHSIKSVKKQARQLYDIQKYRGRVNELVDSGAELYLVEEIAILRMTLERCLNKYDEVELLTNSGQISQLVRDIRDTFQVNKKLESQLGQLLDKAVLDKLCDSLVTIIGCYVSNDKLDEVSAKIAGAVAGAVASRDED